MTRKTKKLVEFMNNGTRRVFNWQQAARRIKEVKPKIATAYLEHQMEMTGGIIYRDSKPVCDTYTYLSSVWDKPMLDMDGNAEECSIDPLVTPSEFAKQFNGSEVLRMFGRWDEHTKWPDSAMKILNGEEENEDGTC